MISNNRIKSIIIKRLNYILYRNNFNLNLLKPIVTITFDDFPKTAAINGNKILNTFDAKATFYISFNLLGKFSDIGLPIANLDDIENLLKYGHELGDHTFDHCDASKFDYRHYEKSIIENRLQLQKFFPNLSFSSFAYPFGSLKPINKKIVSKYYKVSRGIQSGINSGLTDLNFLKSVHISGDEERFENYKKIILENVTKSGWLIFFTHEVESNPTPFGCTEKLLSKILEFSLQTNNQILSMSEVMHSYLPLKG